MEVKNYSLATKYEVDESFDSDRFIKLRIFVCHDGKNPNRSHFSLDAIEKAKETIKNVPILAHVIKDKDGNYDFGGHDFEYVPDPINDGEYRVQYYEIPVGVVPESNNYSIEEQDGRNYVVVDAFIWKGYGNLAPDIIERDEKIKVSMEVDVSEYEPLADDPVYWDIDEYKYRAITLLNSKYGTGMIGANAEIQKFDFDEGKEKFLQFTRELKEELALSEEPVENPVVEESKPEEKTACDNKQEYALTASAKIEKLAGNMEDEWIYNEDGSLVSGKSYCVFDIMEDFVLASMWEYASDWSCERKYIKAKYEPETFAVDKSTVVEVFSQWLTKEEMDMVDANKIQADFALAEMQTKVEALSNENAVLSEFKSDIERQIAEHEAEKVRLAHEAEIDSKLEEFEDEIGSTDDFKTLKETAYSMGADEVELKCFAIVGKNKHKVSKTAKPVVQKPTVSFCTINAPAKNDEENKPELDYGEYNKYIKNGGK